MHKWNKQKHAPLILLFQSKKRQQQHRGKSNIHKINIQKYFTWHQHVECAQKCIIRFAKSKQTWPTARANILANYEFVTVSQSNFCDFFSAGGAIYYPDSKKKSQKTHKWVLLRQKPSCRFLKFYWIAKYSHPIKTFLLTLFVPTGWVINFCFLPKASDEVCFPPKVLYCLFAISDCISNNKLFTLVWSDDIITCMSMSN